LGGHGLQLSWTEYQSGIRALHVSGGDTPGICAELCTISRPEDWFASVFFSDRAIDAVELANALRVRLPELECIGCSSAGELTPDGILDGDVLVVIFPRSNFTVSTLVIDNLASGGMSDIATSVSTLRGQNNLLIAGSSHLNTFALCFIDGMSFAEEAVTAAIFLGVG
jgi:hypothetical protein